MGAKRAAAKPKSRAMKAVAKPKKQAMKKENKRTKAVAGDDDSKKEKEVKKILKIPFARVYPAYIAKVGKRGCWVGFSGPFLYFPDLGLRMGP